MGDKVHLYFREEGTGRFVTHFLVDADEFHRWELAAKLLNLTLEEFVHRAIKEYYDKIMAS